MNYLFKSIITATLCISYMVCSPVSAEVAEFLSKKQINSINVTSVKEYFETLSEFEKSNILKEVKSINDVFKKERSEIIKEKQNNPYKKSGRKYRSNKMIQLFKDNGEIDDGPLLLLVQGLPIKPGNETFLEWYSPFSYLAKRKVNTYFHTIDRSGSLKKNSDELKSSVTELRKKFPNKEIHILGYSAGGAVAIHYFDKLNGQNDNMTLTTVASPLFGYNAPKKILWMSKKLGFRLGVGMRDMIGTEINNCSHFVTVDCNKDIHACKKKNISPQLGLNYLDQGELVFEEKSKMPCGADNTNFMKDDSHVTILENVIKRLF